MTYMYWKKGYKLYAPNERAMYHNYDQSYKPKQDEDDEDHNQAYYKNSAKGNSVMRETIFGDIEYRRHMDVKWGIDLLGRKSSLKAINAGLDPYYFFNP